MEEMGEWKPDPSYLSAKCEVARKVQMVVLPRMKHMRLPQDCSAARRSLSLLQHGSGHHERWIMWHTWAVSHRLRIVHGLPVAFAVHIAQYKNFTQESTLLIWWLTWCNFEYSSS
ncbi:hypothetical protein Plhal304r1_c066g0153931 [Plasmopara halstedii]